MSAEVDAQGKEGQSSPPLQPQPLQSSSSSILSPSLPREVHLQHVIDEEEDFDLVNMTCSSTNTMMSGDFVHTHLPVEAAACPSPISPISPVHSSITPTNELSEHRQPESSKVENQEKTPPPASSDVEDKEQLIRRILQLEQELASTKQELLTYKQRDANDPEQKKYDEEDMEIVSEEGQREEHSLLDPDMDFNTSNISIIIPHEHAGIVDHDKKIHILHKEDLSFEEIIFNHLDSSFVTHSTATELSPAMTNFSLSDSPLETSAMKNSSVSSNITISAPLGCNINNTSMFSSTNKGKSMVTPHQQIDIYLHHLVNLMFIIYYLGIVQLNSTDQLFLRSISYLLLIISISLLLFIQLRLA